MCHWTGRLWACCPHRSTGIASLCLKKKIKKSTIYNDWRWDVRNRMNKDRLYIQKYLYYFSQALTFVMRYTQYSKTYAHCDLVKCPSLVLICIVSMFQQKGTPSCISNICSNLLWTPVSGIAWWLPPRTPGIHRCRRPSLTGSVYRSPPHLQEACCPWAAWSHARCALLRRENKGIIQIIISVVFFFKPLSLCDALFYFHFLWIVWNLFWY